VKIVCYGIVLYHTHTTYTLPTTHTRRYVPTTYVTCTIHINTGWWSWEGSEIKLWIRVVGFGSRSCNPLSSDGIEYNQLLRTKESTRQNKLK